MTEHGNNRQANPAGIPLERIVSERSDTPLDGLLSIDRRRFLEASGYGLFLTALAGCTRAPVRHVLSSPSTDEGSTAGLARYYASTCGGCPAACGVLVKTRDGRPIKLEGNPDHPLSQGGLCAVGQAEVLGLYDSQRLREPILDGKPVDWDNVDVQVRSQIAAAKKDRRSVVMLTGTIHSPTTKKAIAKFLADFPGSQHIVYDPLSASAIAAAHQRTHGERIVPRYRFDQAEVIVGLGADFLGTWISPVEYTAGYRTGRSPAGHPAEMSYHLQVESRMSLTGSNADERWSVAPDSISTVAGQLAGELAALADRAVAGDSPPSTIDHAKIHGLADRLWHARGHALVVCDSQDLNTQIAVNFINDMLGGYGHTLDIASASQQREGDDLTLSGLIDDLENSRVGMLVVAGVNPMYDLPEADRLGKLLAGNDAPFVVRIGQHADETAAIADCVCPESHWLESWSDAEPVAGMMSVCQPTIASLGSSRTLLECMSVWNPVDSSDSSDYDRVLAHWREDVFPARTQQDLDADQFWQQAVQQGAVELTSSEGEASEFDDGVVQLSKLTAPAGKGPFSLALYPKVGLLDGRTAHNPWLQELPDPVSKAVWDNYACLSPHAAEQLGVSQGDNVRVTVDEVSLELPALIQAGQDDSTVAIALGYGRLGTDRFAKVGPQWIEARSTVGPNGLVGINAAPLLTMQNGAIRYVRNEVKVEAGRGYRSLATTQQHHSLSVPEHLATPGTEHRPIVEETTLGAYRVKHEAGAAHHHHFEGELWPDDHPYTGHRWGMVIDLNRCTGCSACVVACQAENNVPVVGRDEVLRSREMHWMRIDRYYDQRHDDVTVVHQPMMCHHCDNAPCENVCPVLATVHSEEGLNQQVYNRCVGTRYCANNCPYKVRRFNWFEYSEEGHLENAALNPDITVRSRGVMEKCSFCVQRIQESTLLAGQGGDDLADGALRTACQQSCPADAILFGDLNNPENAVAKAAAEGRHFQVLSELNVRPSVGYLRVVRNREEQSQETHHV